MPVSEARRRANAKWDAANTTTYGVKVPKALLEQFRAVAQENGEKVNTILRRAMEEYVAKYSTDTGQDTGGEN